MTDSTQQLIHIDMTDDQNVLHMRVFPLIQRYAECPDDFNPLAHGIIADHMAQCFECRQLFDMNTVGGE